MKPVDFDIAICGAGMVGATLAALLVQAAALPSLRIALIDARFPQHAPGAAVDIRVSAVSRATQRILSRAGIWQGIAAQQCCAYQEMRVWDARSEPGGRETLQFSASSLGEPDLGHIVTNEHLLWAALEAGRHERVTRYVAQLQNLVVDAAAAQLTLADGRRLSARLVIGADGAHSASRTLAGIGVHRKPYRQVALVTHVNTERPHQHTAWQRFLPQGPIALLPLQDGRSSIVWTLGEAQADELLQLDKAALALRIAAASDHVLGKVAVDAPCATFPLQLLQVDEYCRQRFVLVGDAAHGIHPLAGQGVNLGMMDAAALVQVLSEARQAGASAEALSELPVLRRYERWRKSENVQALALVDALNRLFSNERADLGALRRAGFSLLQQSPLLKRQLMRRALGLAGAVPEIVKRAG